MINIINIFKIRNLGTVQMSMVRKWQFTTSGGAVNLGVSGHYRSTVEVELICCESCTYNQPLFNWTKYNTS